MSTVDEPTLRITRDHWRITGVVLGDIPITGLVSRIRIDIDASASQTVELTLRMRAVIIDRDTDRGLACAECGYAYGTHHADCPTVRDEE